MPTKLYKHNVRGNAMIPSPIDCATHTHIANIFIKSVKLALVVMQYHSESVFAIWEDEGCCNSPGTEVPPRRTYSRII